MIGVILSGSMTAERTYLSIYRGADVQSSEIAKAWTGQEPTPRRSNCSFVGRSGNLSTDRLPSFEPSRPVRRPGFEAAVTPMQPHAEERDLLKAIAAGDAKALERLFTDGKARVFRLLMRVVKNQAIAEELLNEVFLSVWQNAHRYEGRSKPMTWILSIAHNKAISTLRKKTEVLGLAEGVASNLAAEDDPPDIVAQKHDKSVKIRACMEELSVDHRMILDLVYYQEQSVAEVAEILSIPENTVKTRMFYARKKLSELLLERGIDRGWP
jgi:RNA polymerase sigma-70 factor (ECF subfamily)